MKIGMTIARAAPSTMGTLVATGFMSGGKAVMGTAALGGTEMAAFFEAFTAGIMQRGKSKPGEKTIVDVLLPASQALERGGLCRGRPARGLPRASGSRRGRPRARKGHGGPARPACLLPGAVEGAGRPRRGGLPLHPPGLLRPSRPPA